MPFFGRSPGRTGGLTWIVPETSGIQDKKTRINFWKLPVHLYDRALDDAVNTMKRWILAAIAQAHIKEKLVRTFKGPQRRYAFWLTVLRSS